MSAAIYVPFNYQTTSTTIKTSSYTIPSGKFAKVTPLSICCTINGSYLSTSSVSATYSNSIFTMVTSARFTGRIVASSPLFATILYQCGEDRAAELIQGNNTIDAFFVDGGLFHIVTGTYQGNGGFSYQSVTSGIALVTGPSGIGSATMTTIKLDPFYCNAGDVLSGITGRFSWLVEEYNAIT